MNRQQRRQAQRQSLHQLSTLRNGNAAQNHPQVVLQNAHALFAHGRMREALPLLEQACAAHPDNDKLRTALAYALACSNQPGAAIAQYRELLLREPTSAALMTNLSVLLLKTGQVQEARDWLVKAAQLQPDHANTAFSLGELHDKLNQRDQAFHYYLRATALFKRQIGPHPNINHCHDLIKLASAQMWTGDLEGALHSFDCAIALRPDLALAWARRGLALARLRQIEPALASLRRAAAVEPQYAEVRRAMGDLLLDLGDSDAARKQFQQAVDINPQDTLASYFLAATDPSRAPEAPPPGYVEQLFDEYAEKFEQHLVGVLQYRAPELLCQTIAHITAPPPNGWVVLDLGCGSGLCAALLRPFARHLTGVDVSAKMIEQAQSKQIYDELVKDDITALMCRMHASVDLAVSADVFNYLGKLSPVFAAAAQALRPGGWLAFTTEQHTGDGFALDTTGRYRHSSAYIQGEAQAHGLMLRHHESIVARYQNGQAVWSDIHILQRPVS